MSNNTRKVPSRKAELPATADGSKLPATRGNQVPATTSPVPAALEHYTRVKAKLDLFVRLYNGGGSLQEMRETVRQLPKLLTQYETLYKPATRKEISAIGCFLVETKPLAGNINRDEFIPTFCFVLNEFIKPLSAELADMAIAVFRFDQFLSQPEIEKHITKAQKASPQYLEALNGLEDRLQAREQAREDRKNAWRNELNRERKEVVLDVQWRIDRDKAGKQEWAELKKHYGENLENIKPYVDRDWRRVEELYEFLPEVRPVVSEIGAQLYEQRLAQITPAKHEELKHKREARLMGERRAPTTGGGVLGDDSSLDFLGGDDD